LRNIDDLGLCRFDPDEVRLDDDVLLRIAAENPGSFRLKAETLNRPLHVRPLHHIRLSDGGNPLRVLGHHLKHAGVMRKCLDADIPGLRFNQTFVHSSAKHELGMRDLICETRSRQELGQQRIRIKRDGRKHLIEIVRTVGGGGILWRCVRKGRWREQEKYYQKDGEKL